MIQNQCITNQTRKRLFFTELGVAKYRSYRSQRSHTIYVTYMTHVTKFSSTVKKNSCLKSKKSLIFGSWLCDRQPTILVVNSKKMSDLNVVFVILGINYFLWIFEFFEKINFEQKNREEKVTCQCVCAREIC